MKKFYTTTSRFDFLIALSRMRRSSYSGSSYRQYKEPRPSSCIKVKKTAKKRKVVPNNQKNSEKLYTKTKKTKNQTKTQISQTADEDLDISFQDNLDPQLEYLSRNFELFLCFKNLKSYLQKQIKMKCFKRWQHQFASSVLRHIKNVKSMKAAHEDALFSFQNNQPYNKNPTSLSIQSNINQFYIEDNDTANNYFQPNIQNKQRHHHRYYTANVITNDFNNYIEPSPPPPETSNPDEIANSVISPNSSILVASTSPKDTNYEGNKDKPGSSSSSLSIDKVLDFTDDINRNRNASSSPKNDPVDNFLQTITEFVSSDEFNSDSIGQISSQKNQKKLNAPTSHSPSPQARKATPNARNNNNADDDPLGSTLPNDLFTSSYSDMSPKRVVPKKSILKESPQSSSSPQEKKPQSPIGREEELLIQAALADEFEPDKKRHKSKQSNNDQLQRSPKNRKRRKIIIVHEYSESDYYENDNDDHNYSPINNIYQQHPTRKGAIQRNKKPCFESPQKKFTFSDESFSDTQNQEKPVNDQYNNSKQKRPIQNNPPIYSNQQTDTNHNNINNSNYNQNKNPPANTKNCQTQVPGSNKNIKLADKNEDDDSLHFSSTIELPEIELKDIVKPPSRVGIDVQTDDSSFSNNVSVMTMTDENNDTKPFSNSLRKSDDQLNVNSSDVIDFLIKDDKESPSKIHIKSGSFKPVFNNEVFSDDTSF